MPTSVALDRFINAQEPVWDRAVSELKAGKKRSHWMWFIFPQIQGLGHSDMAQRYAIQNRAEAAAYLEHPVLGERLREACRVLLGLDGGLSAHGIFGSPDDIKLRSSMTLFAEMAGPGSCFDAVLARYFDGVKDARTTELLGPMPDALRRSGFIAGRLLLAGAGPRRPRGRPAYRLFSGTTSLPLKVYTVTADNFRSCLTSYENSPVTPAYLPLAIAWAIFFVSVVDWVDSMALASRYMPS